MATEYESSSSTITKETPKNDVCLELKLLQLIVVQSSLGQTVLRLMDNFLWTVEKCAEWSLPDQEIDVTEDENKKKSGLVRPLPWILFLLSLIILRIIRMTVNAGAFLIGYSQVTPSGLVKFLQISRKRLNNIKNNRMREKQDKNKKSSMNETRRALIKSIRLTLSSLSCLDTSKPTPSPPPTKIHVSSVLDPDSSTTSEEKSATESTDAAEKQENLTSSSESEDEENEEEETLNEKIDRLALENSDEDENFDPANCSNSSIDNSNEEDDDDEDDGIVSSTELYDIIKDAKMLINRTTAMQNQIEKFQASERAAAQAYDQRLPAEKSYDKVEEHLSQRIDSPTCYTPDRSSQEGDSTFYSPISSDSDTTKASIAEKTSKTSGETNNGAVVEKCSTNVSKCHKGKRMSHGNRKKK